MLFTNLTHCHIDIISGATRQTTKKTQQECLMVSLTLRHKHTQAILQHTHIVRCSTVPSRHKITPTDTSTHIERKSHLHFKCTHTLNRVTRCWKPKSAAGSEGWIAMWWMGWQIEDSKEGREEEEGRGGWGVYKAKVPLKLLNAFFKYDILIWTSSWQVGYLNGN